MIIGISGKMGSGKSTLADALEQHFLLSGLKGQPVSVERFKFANVIYNLSKVIQKELGVEEYKDRELLQFLGAHYRKTYGTDFWAKQLKEKMAITYNKPIVIIDDVRYIEEVDVIKEMNGFLVRLDCSDTERGFRIGNQLFLNTSHSSETALDDYTGFDLRLNSGIIPVHSLLEMVLMNTVVR